MKSKTALSTAFIYVIIHSVLTLLNSSSLFAYGADNICPIMIIKTRCMWLFTAVALIIILHLLCKKQGVSLSDAFNDSTARKAVGLLLILGIFLSLPSIVRGTIVDIQSITTEKNDHHDYYYISYLKGQIIDVSISLFLYIGQIILGLYLFMHKRKNHADNPSKGTFSAAVQGIVLLYILICFIISLLTAIVCSFSLHPPYLLFDRILNNSNWGLLLTFATIVLLYFNLRKHYKGSANFFKDNSIRFSAALLIIVDGLLEFSSIFPTVIINYSFWLHPNMDSGSTVYQLEGNPIDFLFALPPPILLVLCGIYLLKPRNGAIDLDDSVPDIGIPKEK